MGNLLDVGGELRETENGLRSLIAQAGQELAVLI